MNKYNFYMITIFVLSSAFCCLGDGDKRDLTIFENSCVGGIVGAMEIGATGHAFSYAMNRSIDGQPFLWKDLYKGVGVNAAAQMPITAVQNVVAAQGKKYFELYNNRSVNEVESCAVSYIAGMSAAVIDTASNSIQLFMQNPSNNGKSFLQVSKELGYKGMLRGYTPNAVLKEGPFTVGYQYLAPKWQLFFNQYIENKMMSDALGGAAAGVAVAMVTQPGAVLRNKMQGDLFSNTYSSTLQAAHRTCTQEGVIGLFRGLSCRGPRVAIAVPLYVYYTQKLENIVKGNN